MKFTIGDKILLKNTGEEGELIAFLGKTMLEVAVNGVHFPVFADEVDHPYLKWFTDPKKPVRKKKSEEIVIPEKKAPERLARSIYLSFMPIYRSSEAENVVEQFRIFLLNETPAAIRFSYNLKTASGRSLFAHQGGLHPFGHIFLHNVSFEEMAEQPRAMWEIAEATRKTKAAPQAGIVRIRPQKLFTHLQALLVSGAPSFSYVLTEDAVINLQKPVVPEALPKIELSATPALKAFEPAKNYSEVIDLHAEALFTNGEQYTPGEILYYQIAALEKHIDTALAAGLDRLVIIHGVGTGALREAVRDVLESSKDIGLISEEWEGSFGYGATIAYFAQAAR